MVRLEQRLEQKQVLTPQQILQASLLQLNTVNLEEKILEELELNPVLEETDEKPDKEETTESNDEVLDSMDDENEYEPANIYDNSKEERYIPIPEQLDFSEQLITQLNLYDITQEEHRLAEEIIWNLDDRGYLSTELVLIADRFEMTEEDFLPILKIVQSLEPVGIGARDLQECLLLQIDPERDSMTNNILSHYFEDFTHKRYDAILKKTGYSREDLSSVLDTISGLNPKPGEGDTFTKDEIVIPDLIVRKRDGRWVILNNDSGIPELRVNPDYMAMMEESGHLSSMEEKKFLRERVDSANWFIQAIKQRRQTLKRVMRTIIDRQPDFFHGKIHQLRPMKLQDVADTINMDISTISRSTRGKYVDTPYGVFELKSFFTEGLEMDDGSMVSNHKIKQSLKKIIDKEDKQTPFNDEQLVEKLKEVGYPIARRTVAKYRDKLNLPVARLRREF